LLLLLALRERAHRRGLQPGGLDELQQRHGDRGADAVAGVVGDRLLVVESSALTDQRMSGNACAS
jgi:hypothetical protein